MPSSRFAQTTHKRGHLGYVVFDRAIVDKSSRGFSGYLAIRGREQQMINTFGGSHGDPRRAPNARAANLRRGIGPNNPRDPIYNMMSNILFGPLPDNRLPN